MPHTCEKRKKNMVFWGTMLVSLVIHLWMFVHISRIYSSETPVVIELSMKDVSKPFVRSIPRPRVRSSTPQVRDVKQQVVRETRIPPMKIPVNEARIISPVTESISVPEASPVSAVPEGAVAGMVAFEPMEKTPPDFITTRDYIDMINMKIQSNQAYPEKARRRHEEGNVRVFFIIDRNGNVVSLKIRKPSRYRELNQAALEAVKKSAPFPSPPSSLFKGDLKLELTIQFELT